MTTSCREAGHIDGCPGAEGGDHQWPDGSWASEPEAAGSYASQSALANRAVVEAQIAELPELVLKMSDGELVDAIAVYRHVDFREGPLQATINQVRMYRIYLEEWQHRLERRWAILSGRRTP